MTPAINVAKQAGIDFQIHEYEHDPGTVSYGDEAVHALGLKAEQVFKTLIADVEGVGLTVAIIPVAGQLHFKSLASALNCKRAAMADPAAAERATGYLLGGISPLGQKRKLPVVVDQSVLDLNTVYVSGGRRGLDISLNPQDLVALLDAKTVSISR